MWENTLCCFYAESFHHHQCQPKYSREPSAFAIVLCIYIDYSYAVSLAIDQRRDIQACRQGEGVEEVNPRPDFRRTFTGSHAGLCQCFTPGHTIGYEARGAIVRNDAEEEGQYSAVRWVELG